MKFLSAVCLVFVAVAGLVSCDRETEVAGSGVSLHTELGGNAEGYQRACHSRKFVFPVDHGAHTNYRNEWWYITGNLQSNGGTRFGFHATFFRVANRLNNNDPAKISALENNSTWAADEFYMAHFAVTQEGTEKVRAHERFSRAAAGLAGAEVAESGSEVKVWLDDWLLLATEKNGSLHWQLNIADGKDALDLTLVAVKPTVLQGNSGYSQKSADPCNASYYYSMPRMRATGTVTSDDQSHPVSGTAWFDREWSSSALADDQVGWDWFALQMDDGRDIMFYQLRRRDGTADPYSHAVEIDALGNKTEIPVSELGLEIDHWWQSETGSRYPVGGRLHRRDTGEVIVFNPLIENQELDLTVRYWEGAIELSDEKGQAVGRGYLELTGY